MVLHSVGSNLSEALINAKKLEKKFIECESNAIPLERRKICSNIDRHMETFLQMTRKRHETWYLHDRHFREALRKEKENYEQRKYHYRQKLLLASSREYAPQNLTPFQPALSESVILPPITGATPQPNISKTSPIPPSMTPPPLMTLPPPPPPMTPPQLPSLSPPQQETKTTIVTPTKKVNTSTITTLRSKPMTKVERRTHQVLRASQKLLDESAARVRYKHVIGHPLSMSVNEKRSVPVPVSVSSSCLFHSPTLIVPMVTSLDCEEYDRLMDESLQNETFSDFVDHFVKFRPEFRERFGLINEARKRQKAIEKLREFNQVHAKTKDERYHRLINSLTDLRSE